MGHSSFPEVSRSNHPDPCAVFPGPRVRTALPHLFPSTAVPFLLGLEAGSLSPGVDELPEGTGLVRGPLVVVAGPPERWLSPQFSLLYSEEEWVTEPLWLKAVEEASML